MNILTSLLPSIEHLGLIGYWLALIVSFSESFAFVGEIIPGTIIIILAGFFSAQGYLDLGDLIWFVAVGAILGDSLSYWLGSKGARFFRPENKILKLSHLDKGKNFFSKHGNKSIILGRFIGPMRPIVPFVAGLFKMRQKKFLIWNIISGFLWAIFYLSVGYFFGGATQAIEAWTTRAGFFVIVALFSILIIWYLINKIKPIFSFVLSVIVSIKNAIVSNQDVQKLVRRHPYIFSFLKRRVSKEKFSGLPLTLILLAFSYTSYLFFSIVGSVISSGSILGTDTRIANLFYAFRVKELITFFTWITTLGKWQVVASMAIITAIALWVWRKRLYILPLFFTLIGSELFNLFGKLIFHRARPEMAYYLEHGFSFPSGHATTAVAFYGFLTYILLREVKNWSRRATVLFWGLISILTIGLSRLYLGVHYITDIWAGYLSGTLFLIVGIAIAEFIIRRRHRKLSLSVSSNGKIFSAILIATQAIFLIIFVLNYHPQLNPQESAEKITVENAIAYFEDGKLPKFTETVVGDRQEPFNFIVEAENDTGLTVAMSKAGWHLADRATLLSVFNLAKFAVLNKNYPTAPMTPSFWNDKIHNFGFEKATAIQNVKERHHARFWKTDLQTADGKQVYVGTVSFDSGIKWLVTHKIAPDIDTERELLFEDLQNTGLVFMSNKESFVPPTLGENFSGDQFFTDGESYFVILKNTTR